MKRRARSFFLATAALLLTLPACKGDGEKKDESLAPTLRTIPVTRERRNDEGLIVRTYDEDNNGLSEITKYFEEVADPDDPARTIRRLRKMEIDVNADGKLNVVRYYNMTGKLASEHLDHDLDGIIDAISYYDKSELVRKEILKDGSTEIDYTRYYSGGNILRIERDTTGDGKIDYWEYYERGVLDRIGRDFNADGRADSWQKR